MLQIKKINERLKQDDNASFRQIKTVVKIHYRNYCG